MAWEDRAYNRDHDSSGYAGGGSYRFLLPSTRLAMILMGVCLGLFILQAVTGRTAGASPIVEWGELTFFDGRAFIQPWRWVTYQYLHGDGWHVFFNLIMLYFFVPTLERAWGWKRTFAFYTLGGVFAGATFGLLSALVGVSGGLIGASGSILAVIGAIAAIAPDMRVIMLVFPMTMRTMAILFAILYLLSIVGDRSLSDAAHLGGLAYGVVVPLIVPRLYHRYSRRRHVSRARKAVTADRLEQEKIDAILAKVSAHGMQSLTWFEKRALHKATEHQRQRDLELSQRRRY